MPTGLASTRILVGLLGEKYGIALASGRTVLTFSKDSACGLPHVHGIQLLVSWRRGSVMVVKSWMNQALY